jgi:hypothetical protein
MLKTRCNPLPARLSAKCPWENTSLWKCGFSYLADRFPAAISSGKNLGGKFPELKPSRTPCRHCLRQPGEALFLSFSAALKGAENSLFCVLFF